MYGSTSVTLIQSPYTEHWFEHKAIWLNIRTGAHPVCVTLSLEEIARIANSLRPVG